MRTAPHGLGQLSAFVVADVARRGADQPRHGVLLHVLGHVDAHDRALVVEQELRQGLRQLGLADAGRADEQEDSGRAVGIAEPGARAAHGVRDGRDRFGLADDALLQLLLHALQALDLALHELGDGHAAPARHHVRDLLGGDLFAQQAVAVAFKVLLRGLDLPLEVRDRLVAQLGRFLVVTLAFDALLVLALLLEPLLQPAYAHDRVLLHLPTGAQRVRLLLQLAELPLQRLQALLASAVLLLLQRRALDLEPAQGTRDHVQLGRHRVDLDAQAAGGLVHQVDGLVRQEAVRDVAPRQVCGGDQRGVLDAHAVVHLVALLQAAQNGDRVLHVRLVHVDGLEAALQRLVLLDVFAVLVDRRGADAVQLAARQRGFDQVAGVGRALGGARPDQRVQLVDEEDDLAVGVDDLLQQGLEALLELAAELRAGEQSAQVQGQHPLALETLGHVSGLDAAGQALDDGGLAHAGVAQQHGVVLRAAAEHLHDAADLTVAPDDRVQLAVLGQPGEVLAVLVQHLVLRLGILVGHALQAADLTERRLEAVGGHAGLAEQLADVLVRKQREHEVLDGDVLVLEPLGFVLGAIEKLDQAAAALPTLGAGDARYARQRRRDRCAQAGGVRADAIEDGAHDAVLRFHEREQHVLRQELLVLALLSQASRAVQGLASLQRHAI